MSEVIPFFNHRAIHASLNSELLEAFNRVLHSSNIMLGDEVKAFEKNVCDYLDCKYAIGVNSGLDALIISLEALGIGKGDEVIVPANTYVATWLAVTKTGATPMPVEASITDYNIDVSKIQEKISPKTKAIMPVHLYGLPCNMDEIMKIANDNNLYVIEDNAQSFGSNINNKKTGTFGKINAHSFYPTKNLGAIGDAGMITTDDEELYNKCKVLRNYGSKEKYINDVIGHNSRLDEIQAAILNVKLKYTDKWVSEKRENAKQYIDGLKDISEIVLPEYDDLHTYHLFVIRTKKRDQFKKHLEEKKINTLIHYPIPPHRQPIYKNTHSSMELPISDEIASTCLSLPNYIGMGKSQIEYICKCILEFKF